MANDAEERQPPVAQFARPVTRTVPLQYPVEFNGKVYAEVNFHRATGLEVKAYVEALTTAGERPPAPPIMDIPQEVYDALDDDDLLEVDKVVLDFLPRRFREAAASTLSGGDPSSPSSPTPSTPSPASS